MLWLLLLGSLHSNIEIPSHGPGYYAGRSLPPETSANIANHYTTSIHTPPLNRASSHPISVGHPVMSGQGLTIAGPGNMNSPKRLSLDERLEKELGIKVSITNRCYQYVPMLY